MLNMILLFIGATELIVIAVIVLLLFGGKKIPELMRGLGRGVKEFKDGMNEPSKPEEKEPEKPEQEQQQPDEKPQDK
jgi:sec-independent protein translocase protein TatA